MTSAALSVGRYFEDLPIGTKFTLSGRTIFDADITAFINCTGLHEQMFTNILIVREMFGRDTRIAPGALVYLMAESLHVAMYQGTALAFLHMTLDMKKAAFAGDTITVFSEVIEARKSKSRPDAGILRTRCKVTDQEGETLLIYEPLRLIRRKNIDEAADL
ncbi:MAG: acyl dehydratase [Bradyrhizobium sp.]|nr:acyl dehydratase [Bradyrhizobium sp.]